MAFDIAKVRALDELDVPTYDARVRKIRDTIADRQRFIEVQ
jgi:hypothetical protein